MAGHTTSIDPGVRRVLEPALGADLSRVRVRRGPRTEALLGALGAPGATCGSTIYLSTGLVAGTEQWWRVLAHECAHTVHQANAPTSAQRARRAVVGRRDSPWEALADAAADRVLAAAPAAEEALFAPGERPAAAGVVQRFNSWEHVLLGNLSAEQMVAATMPDVDQRRDVLGPWIDYMNLWTGGARAASEALARQWLPAGATLVRLLTPGPDPAVELWATLGEVNALSGDFAIDPTWLFDEPADPRHLRVVPPLLQQVRQETFNRLIRLLHPDTPAVNFGGAVTPYAFGGKLDAVHELEAFEKATADFGKDHYKGLLARNACHFAPYAWHRWGHFHAQARDAAHASFAEPDPGRKDEKRNRALVLQAFADHFLQDAFAAGHLLDKTLVMQWFVRWAESSWTLPVPSWPQVHRMTAALQPSLSAGELYNTDVSADSHDPQAAQEKPTYDARVAAAGLVPDEGSRGVAYRNYLSFLTATVVQLGSSQAHDHFNKASLKVRNEHEIFQAYGDEHLLQAGPDVRVPTAAVKSSQQAVHEILATGGTDITVAELYERLPLAVVEGDIHTPLRFWHDDRLEKHLGDTVFGGAAAYMTWFSPTLGLVSDDQQASGFATRWDTSLPGARWDVTSTHYDGRRVVAASHGHAYLLDPTDGRVLHHNGLKGRGYHEIRIASEGDLVFLGTNGWVVGASAEDLTTTWQRSLPGSGPGVVDLLSSPTALYAGSHGRVYRLDQATGVVERRNDLPGVGVGEVRLAYGGGLLIVGAQGYVLGLDPESLETRWTRSLPRSGYKVVAVAAVRDQAVAGSNGRAYLLDVATGAVQMNDGLSGLGYHPVEVATDGQKAFIGTNGRLVAFDLATRTRRWQAALTHGAGPTWLLSRAPALFATSGGYVSLLDPSTGGTRYQNTLKGHGYNEARVATDGATLFTGINGYVVGVALDPV